MSALLAQQLAALSALKLAALGGTEVGDSVGAAVAILSALQTPLDKVWQLPSELDAKKG